MKEVNIQVEWQVIYRIRDQLYDQVRPQVYEQVWNQVYEQLRSETTDPDSQVWIQFKEELI